MTTMRRMLLKCPNCGRSLETQVLTSTNNFGGQRTDFKQIAAGYDPLPAMIHSCQDCGFTGSASEFDNKVDRDVADMIRVHILPHLRDEQLATHTRWEFAARIAEWRKRSTWTIADLYLRASWSAEQDPGKEGYYQRKAADYFEQALEGAASERLEIVYLIGELYRRAGDSAVAESWFDKVITSAGEEDPNTKRIKELAVRQKTNPTDMIS